MAAVAEFGPRGDPVVTDVPARMDRLPWSRWHWQIVIALGITWVLDGLEVTVVGAIAGVLTEPGTLTLSPAQFGFAGSSYIAGAVCGALFFGNLTDRLGRKKLFLITLALYLVATVTTALSWGFWSFAAFRFLTGSAIGGEYAAINSAIDELIPARVRGWADLGINGSYWIGTIIGSAASLVLLDERFFPHNVGWRIAFGAGALLAFAILLVRRHVPESPRWLMMHGRLREADLVVRSIEEEVQRDLDRPLPPPEKAITIRPVGAVGLKAIARVMIKQYPSRTVLCLALMAGQAFFYNAIFFTYALVLTTFYGVPNDRVGLYLIPFALGNILGPLILGPLFDRVGRRPMITFTYVTSGVLLAAVGYLFQRGMLDATTQTLAWSVVFFFASAGASSAYLTVSEIFPLEIRAMTIALFYAVGTALGGCAGPWLFGGLIETKTATNVFYGYLLGAGLMVAAGLVELVLGVEAAGKSLEDVAAPLSLQSVGAPVASPTTLRPRRIPVGTRAGMWGQMHSEVPAAPTLIPDSPLRGAVPCRVEGQGLEMPSPELSRETLDRPR